MYIDFYVDLILCVLWLQGACTVLIVWYSTYSANERLKNDLQW